MIGDSYKEEVEEKYSVSKSGVDGLIHMLRKSRDAYRTGDVNGQEWRICDQVLTSLEDMIKTNPESVEKEVVLDSYIYVDVKKSDLDKSEEQLIEEAKEKAMDALEKAGLDAQIFSEEIRDKE